MELLALAPADRLRLYNTLLGDSDATLVTGSWEWNTVTDECLWSDAVYQILGCSRGDIEESPTTLAAMMHADDRERTFAAFDRAAATLEAPPIEYRIVRPDGQIRTVRARGRTLVSGDAGGAVMVGTLTDLTCATKAQPSVVESLKHRIQMAQPAHGGVAIGAFLGKETTLSLLQYELLKTLIERQEEDEEHHPGVAGFCPSVDLLTNLPWETPRPDGANLKQLIRRTRSMLAGTGLVIEAKRGLGYRLRARTSEQAAA